MKLDTKDLRPSERIFQWDRDTFIVYVALDADDTRPFLRIGNDENIPQHVLAYIQSVILASKEPINIGQELQWIAASLSQGHERVSYLGSKEQTTHLQHIVDLRFSKKPMSVRRSHASKKGMPPMDILLYGPPREDLPKDKVTVQLFKTGNFTIHVGSSRVYDYEKSQKKRISVEREHELIQEALTSQKCRLSDSQRHSFIWLGPEHSNTFQDAEGGTGSLASLYWNMQGKGALVNPCVNYHYALFEEGINPENVQALLSYAGDEPGYTQALCHKNANKQAVAIFNGREQLFNSYKKIYEEATLISIGAGGVLPLLSESAFYASRTRSHGVFSWRLNSETDKITQILFPLGGKHQRRNFEYVRAPHDLEIQGIDTRQDLEGSMAHIALQYPSKFSKQLFNYLPVKNNCYPLVPHKEYVFHQGLSAREIKEPLLSIFKNESYYDFLQGFLNFHLSYKSGVPENAETLKKALRRLQKIRLPWGDLVRRHNLHSYFQFIKSLPNYEKIYKPIQQRFFDLISLKYAPRFTRYKTWLALSKEPVEFHVLLCGGLHSFLLIKKIPKIPVTFKIPPTLAQIEENKQFSRGYQKQLRMWERALDRWPREEESRGYRGGLAFLEKLYEEKLRLLEQRNYFKKFLKKMGITSEMQTLASASLSLGRDNWREWIGQKLERVTQRVTALWGQLLSDSLPNISVLGGRVLPLAGGLFVFIALMSWGIGSCSSGITSDGNSDAEVAAVSLVAPGELQAGQYVPGEEDIPLSKTEVSQYVNNLARRNGFANLSIAGAAGGDAGRNLRNPDLVFPGDTLRLPDLRQANIKKGEYIWELARVHYRKDFARLHILQRQIYARLEPVTKATSTPAPSKKREIPQSIRREINRKLALMRRLAVTTRMRTFFRQTRRSVTQGI